MSESLSDLTRRERALKVLDKYLLTSGALMEFTVASAPIGTKSIFGSLWRQSDVMILHEIADIFVMEEEQLLISLRELAENDAEWKTTIQEHGAVTVALDVGKTIFSLVFVPLPSLPFKAVNTASLLI